MPRPSPPLPRPTRASVPPSAPASGATDLQLAIARTGIGFELSVPIPLACLHVRELQASLPGLRFPLDVSGGVARFRHRRGQMDRLVLEVPRQALEAWAAPRLRGVLGVSTPRVMLLVRRGGATVGLVSPEDGRGLAFEVEMEASGADVALTVHDARGVGLHAPATLLAVRVVHAVAGGAERAGARFVWPKVAARVARLVFPDRGARVPDAMGLAWSAARGHDDAWLLVAQRGEMSVQPSSASIVAREACMLAEAADDAAFGLDLEKARGLLVDALERAPRHRELSRRLAEIDDVLGHGSGRSEAALATLRDASLVGTLLAARLLHETGDDVGAVATFSRAGEVEPIGPLASLAYEAAATLTEDPYDALTLLDAAIARSPALPGPRWARLALRLTVGRVEDARADAEHLHALSNGSRARHAVWLRAGRAFRDAGWPAESGALFERALRYAPRDAEATAGLGAALVSVGKVERGAELLTHAIELAERSGGAVWGAYLDLARVLAEKLSDKPAAIARARDVPSHAAEALVARGLEGRWRAELGDLAGASLAYVKARDLGEARLQEMSGAARKETLDVLLEAAKLESDVKGDWLSAQRHLGAALRLVPGDEAARRAYREAGLRVAGITKREDDPEPASVPSWTGIDPESTSTHGPDTDDAIDHARVEELTNKLRADPANDEVVDELATRLLRLGRTHELFALLSARLDEAGPGRREALLPKQREVLTRLEDDARRAGREDEAALYYEARMLLR